MSSPRSVSGAVRGRQGRGLACAHKPGDPRAATRRATRVKLGKMEGTSRGLDVRASLSVARDFCAQAMQTGFTTTCDEL